MAQQTPQRSGQHQTGAQQSTGEQTVHGSGQPMHGGGQTMQGGGQSMQGGGQSMHSGGQTAHGGGQSTGGGQQRARGGQRNTFDDALTGEMRLALHDAVQARNVCEWCADECIAEGSPEMSECIRLCRDVADLASLYVAFISRGSLFGPEVAESFAIAAEECARECSQHSHSHCQECASVLQRAADSTWSLLDEISGQAQQSTTSQPQQTTVNNY